MSKSFSKLILFILLFSIKQLAFGQIPVNQTGMKQFDDWSPDKTGNIDVTALLQNAVDWCITNSRTLYIAPGTYKVSNQVVGSVFPGEKCGNHDGTNALNIVGDAITRPVIKLVNGIGFNDTNMNNAKAVIHIKQDSLDKENCLFGSSISNIIFDLGNHAGAAAIKFPAAQGCHLTNIKVYSTAATPNFAAGFIGVPGRNAVTTNCEVDKGKYGFYLNNNSIGATFCGIRCTNQTVAGLYLCVSRGTSVTGLHVLGCQGTPVICRGISSGDNPAYLGNVIVTDARIEMTDTSKFAFDINRALMLKNVYVKGSKHIVKGKEGDGVTDFIWNTQAAVNQWTLINNYVKTPTYIYNVPAYNLINGVATNTNPTPDFSYSWTAPTNFFAKHQPDAIYAFNSPGFVNVANYGAIPDDGIDDKTAIQNALNANQYVFLPKGVYDISGSIILNNNNVLLGEAGKLSIIKPMTSIWVPTGRVWCVMTPNVSGYVALQDLAFDVPYNKDYIGAVRWMTSSGFIYNIVPTINTNDEERNKHNFNFIGQAGGKFFGIATGGIMPTWGNPIPQASSQYRMVYINRAYNTSSPNPITFYGLNMERGQDPLSRTQYPFFEAINSDYIRVYGSKTETSGIVYSLNNCDNVSLNSIMATPADMYPPSDPRIIEIKNGGTNIEIAHVYCPYSSGGLMIDDDYPDIAQRTDFIGLYRIGTYAHFAPRISTSIDEETKSIVNVYPTITEGIVNISSSDGVSSIQLFSIGGYMLDLWRNTNQVDLYNYPKGLYFLHVTKTDGSIAKFKIIRK